MYEAITGFLIFLVFLPLIIVGVIAGIAGMLAFFSVLVGSCMMHSAKRRK